MSKRKLPEEGRLTESQALRLAALPNCSVAQAAEVAHTLNVFGNGTRDKKQQLKYVQNAAARVAQKYREDCIEMILCDGQELWLSRLPQVCQRYCDRSRVFAETMKTALRSTNDPLRLVVYCDETVSGNPLNPVASKILCLVYAYFSPLK